MPAVQPPGHRQAQPVPQAEQHPQEPTVAQVVRPVERDPVALQREGSRQVPEVAPLVPEPEGSPLVPEPAGSRPELEVAPLARELEDNPQVPEPVGTVVLVAQPATDSDQSFSFPAPYIRPKISCCLAANCSGVIRP